MDERPLIGFEDPTGEGVIRFRLHFKRGEALQGWRERFPELNAHRRLAFRLGVIGQDPERYGGLAFGNLSLRLSGGRFLITASQTGGKERLSPEDYVLVERVDFERFAVWARGQRPPSSEAVTHAAVYASGEVGAVLHGHHRELWASWRELGFESTPPDIEYGTPEMAREISAVVARRPREGGIAMLGHCDGFLLYAPSLQALGHRLVAALLEVWRLEELRRVAPSP